MSQDSEQLQQAQLASHAALMLSDSSLALFATYLVLVGFDLLPPRILDPLWMISFAGSLCNSMTIPLAGLVFLHGAAALAPLSKPIQSRREFFSRLARWAAVGFLLLLPLLAFANLSGINNINQSNRVDSARIKQNADRLAGAIGSATSAKDLQSRLQQLGGPALPDSELNQPLPLLKKQAQSLINQVVTASMGQLRNPGAEQYRPIYLTSAKSALLALCGAVGFAALSWSSDRKRSMLRRFFHGDAQFAQLYDRYIPNDYL